MNIPDPSELTTLEDELITCDVCNHKKFVDKFSLAEYEPICDECFKSSCKACDSTGLVDGETCEVCDTEL